MVILDIKHYTDEANRQFNDTNNYEQLDFDPKELHNEKIKSKPSIILAFSIFFLTLSNFVFNGLNYLQKKGCAMGTRCAPNYQIFLCAGLKKSLYFHF